MLAGAGGIDLVMLVVAADESVMPQTREHFQICRLLQVPAGILVLTKSDAADPEMLELAGAEVRTLVAGSFLEDAPMVAVSAKTGAGLDGLREALTSLASGFHARRVDGPARLPIDRVFSVKGFGTVVTGTLVSGRIRQDDELTLLPRELTVKARGLQVHGRPEPAADAGRRVAVNVGGVELAGVRRGDTLCSPHAFEVTRRVDALIDILKDARALRHGARVRFHQGTTEVLGRIAVGAIKPGLGTRDSGLDNRDSGLGTRDAGLNNRDAGRGTRDSDSVAEIAPGDSAYVRVRLEGAAVLTRGDRFIIRAYSPSVTIGGGVVLDPHPPRSAIRNAAALARFRQLDAAGDTLAASESAVLAFIEERGAAGLAEAALVSRAGLTVSDASAVERSLTAAGRATRVGSFLLSPLALQALSSRLLAAVAAHHAAQPLSDGMPREEARARLFGSAAPPVFEHVVAMLSVSGRISGRDRLALVGHHLAMSPEETRVGEVVERLFRDAGLAPPDLATVPATAGLAADVVDRMAKLLVRQKTLVRVEALLFHAETLARLKNEVRDLKQTGGGNARVDVATFKARYGITRKYAIPLLEYLDRERITRRVGDARVVL
jgi:selenocysteine-specific elongation factor